MTNRQPRDDEELCRQQFEAWLHKEVVNGKAIEWETPCSDSPDYLLTIDGKRYAVEVTVCMYETEINGQTLSDVGISKTLEKFVKGIEQDTSKNKTLKGLYTVHFNSPIANFSKVSDELRLNISEFIAQTKHLESCRPVKIHVANKVYCAVEKHDLNVDTIESSVPDYGGWESEIRDNINQILKDQISKKIESLKKISNYPVILLLFDAYYFASPNQWKDFFKKFVLPKTFHTIYCVQNSIEGFLITSEWEHLSV